MVSFEPIQQSIQYILIYICEQVFPSIHYPLQKTFQEINPFLANVLILYQLNTRENQKFSGVFKGL